MQPCRACFRSASRATHEPMAVVAHLAHGMKPLVDLVYPPRCPLCGAALANQDGLCVDCWSLLDIPGEGGGEAAVAWLDRGRPVAVHAATLYNDASRRLVLDYKHGRRIALARLLARLMAARLPSPAEGEVPLLVPVPLHRWRLWQRGFNQAALLAGELALLGKGEALKAAPAKFPTAMSQRIERGVAYRCGQAQNFRQALTGGLGRKGRALVGLIEPSNLSHYPIKPLGAHLNGHFLFKQRAANGVRVSHGQVIFGQDRFVPHEGCRVEQ